MPPAAATNHHLVLLAVVLLLGSPVIHPAQEPPTAPGIQRERVSLILIDIHESTELTQHARGDNLDLTEGSADAESLG